MFCVDLPSIVKKRMVPCECSGRPPVVGQTLQDLRSLIVWALHSVCLPDATAHDQISPSCTSDQRLEVGVAWE